MSHLPFQIDASDAERVARAFELAPQVVRDEIRGFLHLATTHLKAEVQDRTPTGAHQLLRQSITDEVFDRGMEMLGVVGSPLDYAPAVELGTKPHWAPIQPLEEWARIKLGLRGDDAERAAKRIQYAIAHRGTLGVGMFHRAYAANERALAGQYRATVQRIADRIAG